MSSSKSTSKSSSTTNSKSTASRPTTTSTVRSAPPKPASAPKPAVSHTTVSRPATSTVTKTATVAKTAPKPKVEIIWDTSLGIGGSSKTTTSTVTRTATVAKTTQAPPKPAPKTKNVDKVDFGKPKPPKVTYDPPKPSKAELERIERLKAIEEAKSALPAAIDQANKAYKNLEEAIKKYDEAAETLRVHTKDAQENGFFSSTGSKWEALTMIFVRISTRYKQFLEAGALPLYAGGAAAVVGTIEGLLSDIMIYEVPGALQAENQIKEDAKNVDIANEKVMGAATLLTTAKMQLGYHIKEADGKNLDKLDDLELSTTRQEIRRLFGV